MNIISCHEQKKYGLVISENTIKFVPKRNKVPRRTWNKARPNSGKGMARYEKFKESKVILSGHVYEYPMVLLEELFRKVGSSY